AAVEPDVTISIQVDLATADPADILTYTITVNNGGPQAAPSLWVNDTINDTVSDRATYVDDTGATDIGPPVFLGRSFAGNVVQFRFANVPPGSMTFRVRARVGFAVTDGQTLLNTAALWYTNATGAAQLRRSSSASTTVSIPVISAAKSVIASTATTITYRVTISNSGTGTAQNLWWNDTLPVGTQYASHRARPPPDRASCSTSTRTLNCTMTVVFDPGSRSWDIDATIPTPLAAGSTITNWVFVNYTDSDGTFLGEVHASAEFTVAAANIQTFKLADALAVPPGGTIGYQIFYNNTGQVDARDVWVNDTLPQNASLPAVTVISATPAPVINTSSTVRWQLTNVAPGVHFVSLVVRALPTLADGTRLNNSVVLNYTNSNGQGRPGSASSATTRVSLTVPLIDAALVADRSTVEPGGTIRYSLYYNNSRPALSALVTAEVLLPAGIALVAAAPGYNTSVPAEGKYVWTLTNVGSGSHAINLTVSVPVSAATGTILRTTAFVNYTDDGGSRVGGSQVYTVVAVYLAPPPPEGPPWGWIALGVVIAVVVAAIALRLYLAALDETVIDEVFLLHRDGLLVKHYTRRLKPDVDSDILSGMLIAVQNFVNESFIGEAGLKKEGQLDEMKFGQYRILLTRGRFVIVAAVVSGPRVERVPAQIRAAIDDLEKEFGRVLERWDGNMEEVAGADRYMQDLIAGRYRGRSIRLRANH
ncbi:MAG TPA: hypothetical protein VI915_01010, partial [Thermoplasmata archaeon]|nr:hypothetical protein [Thermoplasmata archaeon]